MNNDVTNQVADGEAVQMNSNEAMSAPAEFAERYKHVQWRHDEIPRMLELAERGLLTEYIEHRREEELVRLGMMAPTTIRRNLAARQREVDEAAEQRSATSEAATILKDVSTFFSILKKTKIAVAFQGFGIALGITDFIMSLINLGQEDPTVQMIREGFNAMMYKMAQIESQLGDLENLVEWNTIRTLLGPSEDALKSALIKYQAMQEHIDTPYEATYLQDFLNYCAEIGYEHHLVTLTNAFTSNEAAFGVRNLPVYAYQFTRHNYAQMRDVFTVVGRLFVGAMHMHLFICRKKGLNLDYESNRWTTIIDNVTQACDTQLTSIVDGLPDLVDEDFNKFFLDSGFEEFKDEWWSYDQIARKTRDFFTAKYPFANFAVMAYSPMLGSTNHHIGWSGRYNRVYLHHGPKKIHVYLCFEHAKKATDFYASWLLEDGGANSRKLDETMSAVHNHLNNNRKGDAQQIRERCPADSTGQRSFVAFIVPDSNLRRVHGEAHSNMTRFVKNMVVSTGNTSNWNFSVHRYFGKDW